MEILGGAELVEEEEAATAAEEEAAAAADADADAVGPIEMVKNSGSGARKTVPVRGSTRR